jgi:hypothetical protein
MSLWRKEKMLLGLTEVVELGELVWVEDLVVRLL